MCELQQFGAATLVLMAKQLQPGMVHGHLAVPPATLDNELPQFASEYNIGLSPKCTVTCLLVGINSSPLQAPNSVLSTFCTEASPMFVVYGRN